jgi:hypothetical protein
MPLSIVCNRIITGKKTHDFILRRIEREKSNVRFFAPVAKVPFAESHRPILTDSPLNCIT